MTVGTNHNEGLYSHLWKFIWINLELLLYNNQIYAENLINEHLNENCRT